jgi:glycosyltransferase involved in cell wall biosynthesis
VIIPTAGRESLTATLASFVCDLGPGDEVIVVRSDDGDFGNSARNSAIERARGSHLIFIDDDDEYLPDALQVMREEVARQPDKVLLFLRRYELSGDAYPASVGGVFPNVPGRVGRFEPAAESIMRELRPRYPDWTDEFLAVRAGDLEFMRQTLELRSDEPVRVPAATIVARPEKSRWRRLRFRLHLRSRLV